MNASYQPRRGAKPARVPGTTIAMAGIATLALAGCGGGAYTSSPQARSGAQPTSGISAQMSCASLTALALPGTKIVSAVEVPAGPLPEKTGKPTFPPHIAAVDLPAYCRVTVVTEPSITSEIWMPLTTWNGRFQGVGNHGFAGALDYGDMSYQLARGYAVASTDTGHAGNTPLPWMQNQQQIIDYGYRAVHEMTVNGKSIVNAFYKQPAQYAYWNGCSTGGRQALMSAQRYPSDYDGISVGDPNYDQIGNRAQYVWNAQATFANAATTLTPAQLGMINKAVIAQCDAIDGVVDGLLEDPRLCTFKPASLQCAAGTDPATCLSTAQVGALEKLYAGPSNPRTGAPIYAGLSMGSETGWTAMTNGPTIAPTADLFFKHMVFKDPSWDYRTFDFDSGWTRSTEHLASVLNAADADLRAFEQSGGKMMHYNGWRDVVHPALSSVQYYEGVVAALNDQRNAAQALARTQDFYRLFVIPGSKGCSGGGDGPDRFDPMDHLVQWVEKGVAPDQIVVKRADESKGSRTRPVCAYPQVSVYKGSGSIEDAASFSCQNPRS